MTLGTDGHVPGADAEADRRRALLRQLRDLDDDLAAGKLTDADHRRLRAPLEREAAAVLRAPRAGSRRRTTRSDSAATTGAAGSPSDVDGADNSVDDRSAPVGRDAASGASARAGADTADAPDRDAPAAPARRSGAARARGASRRRRLALVAAAVAGAAGVAILLANAATPRPEGGTATGDVPAAATTAPPAAPPDGSAAAPAGPPGAAVPSGPAGAQPSMTAEQAAAIDTAALDVKAHPQDVGKHITLAHAYASGGATQLAAVEYLAILKLDPVNAEANTQLALLAFEVGQPQQAKTLLDKAIAADPNYAEALYVRGLVLLSGLHQPQAAAKDLHAYLAAAPYGSHRTAAETLLALAGGPQP